MTARILFASVASTTRLEMSSRIIPSRYRNINSSTGINGIAASSHQLGSSNRQSISAATASCNCRCHPTLRLILQRSFSSSTTPPPPPLSSSSIETQQHYDIIIAGGGVVGSVLARLLLDDNRRGNSRRLRPIRVALVETRPSPPSLKDFMAQSATPHPRAYALSPTSLSYLGTNILQSLLQHNRIGIYDSMQIWEHDGPAQLHFVGDDLWKAIQDDRLVDLNAMIHEDGRQLLNDDDDNNNNNNNNNDDGHNSKKKNTTKRPWLGAVVEDAPLVSSLWEELRQDTRIDLIDNVGQITSITAPSPQEVGNAIPPPPVQFSFIRRRTTNCKNGNGNQGEENTMMNEGNSSSDIEVCTITSNLLVAADGANSFVRRTIGNFPIATHSYGRKAVTCTVQLEHGLKRTAYQRFLPHGPIALLPVWNGNTDHGGGRGEGEQPDAPIYANVVWSTTPTEANRLLALSPSEFLENLNYHLRQGPNVNPSILRPPNNTSNIPLVSTLVHEFDSLLRTANAAITMGTWTESPSRNHFRLPPKSIAVVSPMMGFDLAMSHVASDYTYSSRVALVGDAAHTMHPMAGQGLNLGLDDASSLARLIKEAIDCGMDVGGTSLFLDRYNQERFVKGWGIVAGVHGLHELFGCSASSSSSNNNNNNADNNSDSHGIMNGGFSGEQTTRGLLRDLLGYSRSLGMNAVNGLPFVRQTLAEIAAGATPPFPK